MSSSTVATTAPVDPSWWAWAGAHGGYVAALALTALRGHVDGSHGGGRPVRTMTTNFLAPVDERRLDFEVSLARSGRRVVACTFTGGQGGAVALVGSAIFGAGQAQPEYEAQPAPAVPEPERCRPFIPPETLAAFARHLEIRPATADRPLAGGERAELVAWIRFADRRRLTAEALVILADALPPALYARWTVPRPVPTAELTVHFTDPLDADPVGAPADSWALVRIRTEHSGGDWAIDDSAVWSADRRLLVLARQARRVVGGRQ